MKKGLKIEINSWMKAIFTVIYLVILVYMKHPKNMDEEKIKRHVKKSVYERKVNKCKKFQF